MGFSYNPMRPSGRGLSGTCQFLSMRVLTLGALLAGTLFLFIVGTSVRKSYRCAELRLRSTSCASGVNKSAALQPTLSTKDVNEDNNGSMYTVDYCAMLMEPFEIDTILAHICNVNSYLEWGSGGSTLNFAPFARRVAHSIEHDAGWCRSLQRKLSRCAECDRVHHHCVHVPRGYRNWGRHSRFEEGTYHQFDTYVDKVDDLGERSFDFVLIDGRARVAAAVKTLAYISPDSRVVLHDASRIDEDTKYHPKYELVRTYYDFEELVLNEGLPGVAVMRRKPEWDFLEGNVSAVNTLLMGLPI